MAVCGFYTRMTQIGLKKRKCPVDGIESHFNGGTVAPKGQTNATEDPLFSDGGVRGNAV